MFNFKIKKLNIEFYVRYRTGTSTSTVYNNKYSLLKTTSTKILEMKVASSIYEIPNIKNKTKSIVLCNYSPGGNPLSIRFLGSSSSLSPLAPTHI